MAILKWAWAAIGGNRGEGTGGDEGGGDYTPALDFSDERNSQYIPLL